MNSDFYDNWIDSGNQVRYHLSLECNGVPHAFKYVDGVLYLIPVEGGVCSLVKKCTLEEAKEYVALYVKELDKCLAKDSV